MAAQLSHTIISSSDQLRSARFLTEMLGRPAPVRFGPFLVVELDNGVSLDFASVEGPIAPQHYAFLISEADLDAVIGRVREQGLKYWADPMRHRPGEINHNDGGRGVYFLDPDGHYMEAITRSYGAAPAETLGSWQSGASGGVDHMGASLRPSISMERESYPNVDRWSERKRRVQSRRLLTARRPFASFGRCLASITVTSVKSTAARNFNHERVIR